MIIAHFFSFVKGYLANYYRLSPACGRRIVNCQLYIVNCSLCQGGFTDFFSIVTTRYKRKSLRWVTRCLRCYVARSSRGDNPTGRGEDKNPSKNGRSPLPYGFSPRAPFSPFPSPLVRFFLEPFATRKQHAGHIRQYASGKACRLF